MVDCSEVFVGMDISKDSHAVAVAESGRDGEARFYGEIGSDGASVRRFVRKLERLGARLRVCYEAGPTGYGLQRLIEEFGHECAVIAPSLISCRPGERVKTNRRDAVKLARLFRAGELSEIWTPDEAHEAMRDLVRSREAAVKDRSRKRQEIRSFLLRHGKIYPSKQAWSTKYFRWLHDLGFAWPGQIVVLHEMIVAETQCRERVARLDQAIEDALLDAARTGGGAPSGAARRRADRFGHLHGGGWRHPTVRKPSPPDGLARPGALRGLDGRQRSARQHHQNRQRTGAQNVGRERLDLPLSRASGEDEILRNQAFAGGRPGNGMEGAGAPDEGNPPAGTACRLCRAI